MVPRGIARHVSDLLHACGSLDTGRQLNSVAPQQRFLQAMVPCGIARHVSDLLHACGSLDTGRQLNSVAPNKGPFKQWYPVALPMSSAICCMPVEVLTVKDN
jgi:hypothetical protein